jgi:flagellum-specific peptidoglycan hydrolase FlgJ
MTPSEFISKIRPGADLCEATKGIPSEFTVAQAALESGWGSSKLTLNANNLFGIKADKSWRGSTTMMMTSEYIKGKWIRVPATWRRYDTWADCLLDHADFFHVNSRYKLALEFAHDPRKFAIAVAGAGYATDPDYAEKIIRIIKAHDL